jgi:hypothetical protein
VISIPIKARVIPKVYGGKTNTFFLSMLLGIGNLTTFKEFGMDGGGHMKELAI